MEFKYKDAATPSYPVVCTPRLLPKGIESVDASSRHARCMNPISCAVRDRVHSELQDLLCEPRAPFTSQPLLSATRSGGSPVGRDIIIHQVAFEPIGAHAPWQPTEATKLRNMLPATSAWVPVDLHVERQEGSNILPPTIRHKSGGT